MYNPVSTYRIQFHKGFTFSNFEQVIPYLAKLGVATIYASPIFSAVSGSNHGYDCLDPLTINPEIGSEEQLRNIRRQLETLGIGWMQDIVPNHMAYHTDNAWLMDALAHGSKSQYASFFDIDWRDKLMVPLLGNTLEAVVANKQLFVDRDGDKLVLKYYENKFPLSPGSYNSGEDPESINNDEGRLRALLDAQHYRLCRWQETDERINYRRFFTINGLMCLNIQDSTVFQQFHIKIKELVDDGIFNGLRIDHIDGLSDPQKYLEDLRALIGDKVPVVVEKILGSIESLPADWPVQGNTGYDFLALVNNLLTNREAKTEFTKLYRKIVNDNTPLHQQIHAKKAHILFEHMGGELENLCRLFLELNLVDNTVATTVGKEKLRSAIAELLIQCPVYRFYGNRMPLPKAEQEAVKDILNDIRESKPYLSQAVDMLQQVFLTNPHDGDKDYNERAARFYKRCMQFAGPLMAKGVEDTLMYTYNRFIGHNDVGDSPEAFGITVGDFHRAMMERQLKWPLTLNATATHDTKRGEDVRARLNVLTDLPELWKEKISEWRETVAELKFNDWPEANDEYFIYQVLTGAYPFDEADANDLPERLEQYLRKALREAKLHSCWSAPNTEYEETTQKFTTALLDQGKPFWPSFKDFLHRIADAAIVNSLSQTVLKFTCPGVPDIYQGAELWDLSLVDPDNRRPVDYAKRIAWLEEVAGIEETDKLWAERHSAKIKLWLTHRLMTLRKQYSELFAKGNYLPIEVKGKYKKQVMAFARRYKNEWCLVAVPLHIATLVQHGGTLGDIDWNDTRLVLPDDAPKEWMPTAGSELNTKEPPVADLFNKLPFAVLTAKRPAKRRSAGILLAISSLPSDYGVGDLGSYARRFAKFLSRSQQKYWQILPLNPTEAGAGHSPYSSVSSMAGNILLLSPELLVKAGLLDGGTIKKHQLPHKDKADYADAMQIKNELFETAYMNYSAGEFDKLRRQFEQFCVQEAYWLDDYALYSVIKQEQNNKPWYEWPVELKQRDGQALQTFRSDHEDAINKVKWLQLQFSLQWNELKEYCNGLDVQVFGDMPFYVSYDSADVWAHRDIFSLDVDGRITGIAGVPPDYFSEDGQLWGMPTFNWDVVKTRNYDWWIKRLRKNLELFDLVRLDHFRAFAEYWEVPAGEITAKNGVWKKGPGKEFFDVVAAELGSLPFVAEDLGVSMEQVYALRDEIGLPGMRVLQFAFGEHLPNSVDAPHNYVRNAIVYTGTHDNNTTLGWYQQEANRADHKRLEEYNGTSLREKDVHFVLGRMAYSSIADIAILPMQDVLGLGEQSRMNTPGSTDGNWLWRVKEAQLSKKLEKLLRSWTEIYNRY
ncbi:MAG: 4-alpha-glucanotransferase [Flavipsychrobacter sp.]|nr:4-alpha-glucanotransferase [Flavipsychrobacter sp.]